MQSNVQAMLTPEQKAALLEQSRRVCLPQSEIVRMAIARFLADPPPIGLELARTKPETTR